MPEVRFFEDRDGNAVAYAVSGNGPLLICPAWWVSHVEKDWGEKNFRTFCDVLGEGLTLVRYDRPGVGLSDRNAAPRSLQNEANLIADVVDELGADQYSLLAMSCAGPPTLLHTSRQPERVSKLVFYGSYPKGQDICEPDVQQAVLATIRANWGMGSRAMADIFLPDEDRETFKRFAELQLHAAGVEKAAELLELTYDMDAQSTLSKISRPTLVLHRRGDRAIPHSSGIALARGIPDARLISLEGRAHPPWFGGLDAARYANAFVRGLPLHPGRESEASDNQCELDSSNRCLVLDRRKVPLTPLEYGVMAELIAAEGELVTRDHLLETVWKQPFEGSNRIDALVRGLRKKLGNHACAVETVIGHGFRFAGWARSD